MIASGTTYGLLKWCPECGGERLIPVATIEGRNFFCRDCDICWHLEHGLTTAVDPQNCPGCQLGATACSEQRGMCLGWGDIESELYGSVREACCFAFSG